jgi:hypothetical protein
MIEQLKHAFLVSLFIIFGTGVLATETNAQVFTATSQPTDVRLIFEEGVKVEPGMHARACLGCREHNTSQVVFGVHGTITTDEHEGMVQYALQTLDESLWISPVLTLREGGEVGHSLAVTAIPGPFQANVEVLEPLEDPEMVLSAGYFVEETVYVVPGFSWEEDTREEFIAFRWPFTDKLWLQGRWDTDSDRVLLQVFAHGNVR